MQNAGSRWSSGVECDASKIGTSYIPDRISRCFTAPDRLSKEIQGHMGPEAPTSIPFMSIVVAGPARNTPPASLEHLQGLSATLARCFAGNEPTKSDHLFQHSSALHPDRPSQKR